MIAGLHNPDFYVKNRETAHFDQILQMEQGGTSTLDVEKRLDELVNEVRQSSGKKYPTGNGGAAVVDIEGVTKDIKTYSKYNNSISGSNLNHEYSYNFGEKTEYLRRNL